MPVAGKMMTPEEVLALATINPELEQVRLCPSATSVCPFLTTADLPEKAMGGVHPCRDQHPKASTGVAQSQAADGMRVSNQ
jgi:hypothetical protein